MLPILASNAISGIILTHPTLSSVSLAPILLIVSHAIPQHTVWTVSKVTMKMELALVLNAPKTVPIALTVHTVPNVTIVFTCQLESVGYALSKGVFLVTALITALIVWSQCGKTLVLAHSVLLHAWNAPPVLPLAKAALSATIFQELIVIHVQEY